MIIEGRVTNVFERDKGSTITADLAANTTVIPVLSTYDFDVSGGTVEIDATSYAYTSIDQDNDTITIASPGLLAAVDDGEDVLSVPYGRSRKAMVALDDDSEGIEAFIPIDKYDLFELGIRNYDEEETVTVSDESGDWVITNAEDQIPVRDGSFIDPATVPPAPPIPPAAPVVPTFNLTGMPRGIMLQVTNPQPGWTYSVEVTNTTTPETVDITQTYPDTERPVMYFENMPDGTPLDPASDGYTFKVTATNVSGSAVSPVSEVRPLVLNDDSTIAELAVGKLIAGDLVGAFALLGALNVGANIEITPEDGIVVHTPLGDTKLPADGQSPTFTGSATFDALTILGNLGLQGLTNEVSKGSTLELATGTTAPKTAPVMSSYWPEKTIHNGFNNRGFTRHTATGRYYAAESLGGAVVSPTNEGATDFAFTFGKQVGMNSDPGGGGWGRPEVQAAFGGVVISGNAMYVLCETDEALPGTYYGRWYVYKGTYNAGTDKWEYATRWLYEPNGNTGANSREYPAIGLDEITGEILIAQAGSGSGALNLSRYATGGAFVDRVIMNDDLGANYKPGKGIRAIGKTLGDFGTSRYYVVIDGETTMRIHSGTTHNYIPGESFPLPSSATTGAMWDASKSIFRNRIAGKAYDHTTLKFTTYSVVQTWRKANAVSPAFAQYETDKSPAAITTTFPRRAAMLLTSGPIPDDITDPNDPDSLTFYAATNDLSGLNTSYKRQAPPAVGIREQRFITIPTTGGSPPTAPNFPAATPAFINSRASDVNGAMIKLQGSGAWRLGDVSGDASGRLIGGGFIPIGGVIPYAGATPPTGFLSCDGGTFSSVTYPLLAAVLGSTYGAISGTTYTLPDLRSRTLVGSGGQLARGANEGNAEASRSPVHSHASGSYTAAATNDTMTRQGGSNSTVPHTTHTHNITGQSGTNLNWGAGFPHIALPMIIRAA